MRNGKGLKSAVLNLARKELGQRKADEALKDLQHRYDVLVDSIEGDGFNPGIFDAATPTAVHVLRSETDTEQIGLA